MRQTRRFLIGDLASTAGVNASTIRYYEELGLLPPPDRTEAGYRLYGVDDIERVSFIRRARALDFGLDEIREILRFREHGQAPCPYVLSRLRAKVKDVERRITELAALRDELVEIEGQASAVDPVDLATAGSICLMIEDGAAGAVENRRVRKP